MPSIEDRGRALTPPPVVLKGQGGEGPDLLLIHGFGSDRMSWLANAPALAANFTVTTLDLPGHGLSGPEVGDGRIETLAAAVEAALDRRGTTRTAMVGHSLGGGIALLIAARRPDLVDALVLLAPAGLGRGVDPGFLHDYPLQRDPAETEALLQRLVTRPRLINKQLVALVQKQLAAPGAREAFASVGQGIANAAAVLGAAIDAVIQADLPRLTIWGEADRINPLDAAALAAFGGDTCIIPDTGHLPHVEAAAAVNTAILRFLGDPGRGRNELRARDSSASSS